MQGYRGEQEDHHSIHLGLPKHPQHSFVGVYDGHSGSAVSAWLKKELWQRFDQLDDPMDEAAIIKCIKQADTDYIAQEDGESNGSACICAVLKEDKEQKQWDIVVANVGDSRVLLVKEDGSFVELSEDHKPENPEEKARIEAAGGHVKDDRVDGQLAMSRAMGDKQYKGNKELGQEEQKVIPVAEVRKGTAVAGDRLLVCCDGIVEQLQNAQVAEFLHAQRGELDNAQLCSSLLDFSLKAGSTDNHTALLVSFGADESHAAGYASEPELLAGPFSPYASSEEFVKAYQKDAAKFGIGGAQLEAMAKQTEEKGLMPVFPMKENPQEKMLKMFGPDLFSNPAKMAALQAQLRGEQPPPSPEEQQAALLRQKIEQIKSATAPTAPKAGSCNLCGKAPTLDKPFPRCAACKSVQYCCPEHQKSHWKAHKGDCKRMRVAK